MIRVYTASKLTKAVFWRKLHDQVPHVFFHARWLKHNQIGTPDLQAYAARFWLENAQDVKSADVLLLYVEEGEHLRGALVEAGMALAFGVPVIVVGVHPDYGTWQYHADVKRAVTFNDAMEMLRIMDQQNGTG